MTESFRRKLDATLNALAAAIHFMDNGQDADPEIRATNARLDERRTLMNSTPTNDDDRKVLVEEMVIALDLGLMDELNRSIVLFNTGLESYARTRGGRVLAEAEFARLPITEDQKKAQIQAIKLNPDIPLPMKAKQIREVLDRFQTSQTVSSGPVLGSESDRTRYVAFDSAQGHV